MIVPVILPLDAAVSAVAAASSHEQVVDATAKTPSLNHVHVFDMARSASGLLVASHASHASHSSHVSSSLPGGGGGTVYPGDSTVVTYTPPSAPSWVYATAGNGTATVAWSPVYSDDAGLVTYVVTAYPGGLSTTVTGITTAMLAGLQNGVTYSFTVTASNSAGSGPSSVASAGTTPVAPPLPRLVAQQPIIVGQAAVHQMLEVETPGWTSGTSFSYQWYADGAPVVGATDRRFSPTAGLKGRRITAAVAGAKLGYASSAAISSAPTHKVALAAIPKILGTLLVGKTLRARAGKWTPGTNFTYRWFVGGRKIAKESDPTLVLKPKYAGKTISVQVTGAKTGYGRVTLKSPPTHDVRH